MSKHLTRLYHPDGALAGKGMVFVFGSNLRGRHGLGAARAAALHYGALEGVGEGLRGHSYAIATKDRYLRSLGLQDIKEQVAAFCDFTQKRPELEFFITRVGCGYAGYKDWQIAPLFLDAHDNCHFPQPWKPYLE